MKPELPVDIYIRVSRVGSRDKNLLRSPEDQEADARAFALSKGLEVGEVFIDIDKSGGTLDRPGLQEAIRRVEDRVSGGIIVAYLSRATRDTLQGLGLLDRITAAGGAVYAPNLPDYTTPDGKMLTTIQLAIDTGYRELKKAELERAKEAAIKEGTPISTRPAVGLWRKSMRLEDGREKLTGPYLVDRKIAPVIHEVFERRAGGDGPVALGAFLEAHGVLTSQGSKTWSKQAVYGLLANRVYLGELAYGKDRRYVNPEAHEAIVDLPLWQAAQHPNGRLAKPTSRGNAWLLAGIVRCRGCGHCLQGTTSSRGKRIYRCTRRHAGGVCPEPVTIDAAILEAVAIADFWTLSAELEAEGRSRRGPDEVAALTQALDRAQRRLVRLLSPEVQDEVGDTAEWAQALGKARATRDRAAESLGRARAAAGRSDEVPSTKSLRAAWKEMRTADRRELLGLRFDCMAVGRDRTIIAFRHGSGPTDLPTRGFRRNPRLAPIVDVPDGARMLTV